MKFTFAFLLSLISASAFAQTSPNLRQGQVLTPAQWNQLFINKQDTLGYTPLNSAGGVMTGRLVTPSVPNGVSAGFNLTPGSAPPTPINGDLWTTSAGIFAQINGATINLTGSTGASFAGTSPITVSFPAGVVTYACATCGVTGSPLSQFASTTSAQLAGIISNETGTGVLVFGTGPTLTGVTITTSFSATGLIPLTSLSSSQAANTVVGNGTGSPASPTALAMPSCIGSANALQWTSGTGFGCGAIVAAAGSVAVGTTTITGGTVNNILVHGSSNILQEYTLSGTGTVVAMAAAPTIIGGSHTAITNLGIRSTAAAFDMVIANAEVLTANRALTITLGDSARLLTFGGNIVTAGSFTTSGAFSLILTQTGATNVTLPTTGTLATITGSENFLNKTYNGLAITANGANTLNITGGKTLAVSNSITLTGTDSTTMTFPTTSATIARTDASQTFSGIQTFVSPMVIAGSNTNMLNVGLNGSTNPALVVDTSTASSATGINIKSNAAGNRAALSVISSGANEILEVDAKGGGAVVIGSHSNGGVNLAAGGGGVTIAGSVNSSTPIAFLNGGNAQSLNTGGLCADTAYANCSTLPAAGLQISGQSNLNGGLSIGGTITTGTVTIAGGASVTALALSTGSITVNCTTRPFQSIIGATSAWSITAPSTDGSCIIKLTNAASSAVAPSFSGFAVGSNTGATLTTVGSSIFMIYITRVAGTSFYSIYANQ